MTPDHQCLFSAATSQHGYFTSSQAHGCGISNELIRHHVQTGRYRRIRRGLFRLRDYPSFYREHVLEAVLAVGKDRAVVSHESALELYELSDAVPNVTHLTVFRTSNTVPKIPGTRIHLTTRPWKPGEIRYREGIPLTSPERSIVDAAELGTGPEQVEMAIFDALDRGITTSRRIRVAAFDRSARVRALIEQGIALSESRGAA